MSLGDKVASFLPTDPGYAPFGWQRLRGLNMLPLMLAGLVAVQWSAERLAFTLAFGPMRPIDGLAVLPSQLLLAEIAFVPMLLAIVGALNLPGGRSVRERIAWMGVAIALGAALHGLAWRETLCLAGLEDPDQPCYGLAWRWSQIGEFARAAMGGGLIAAVLALERREREGARAQHETQIRRLNAERQETEARLQSLQAQIEPHFLFNTLAHIQRLHEIDAGRGRTMLGSLIEYLRSAQPQMREPVSTLGRELALTRAYANVQQIRMGDRLRVDIAVPDDLLGIRMPPMMVLTLAENSVKHGLGPKREGGTLQVRAQRRGERLEVVVSDDGAGLRMGSGSGRGLSNTRARLATQYGARASLDISSNADGGVRATLVLPLEAMGGKATSA
jgi:hypothetical protein